MYGGEINRGNKNKHRIFWGTFIKELVVTH